MVVNSSARIYTSRYIAIHYIVLKLDNNDETYNSAICEHRTHCMHTGCKNFDMLIWKVENNAWVK